MSEVNAIQPSDYFLSQSLSLYGLLCHERKKYVVYESQRFYEWELDELNDFWSDYKKVIKNSFNSEWREDLIPHQRPHFMGAIVVTTDLTNHPNAYLLIDGQQRIATCTILLATLKDLISKLSGEEQKRELSATMNSFIRMNLYGEPYDPVLKLKDRINDHFLNFIQKPSTEKERLKYRRANPPKEMDSSYKRILRAYDFFKDKLKEEFPDSLEENETHDKLLAFFKSLSRKLFFLRIEVRKENTAYVIFETLNKRGKDLSESALVKNKFFRSVKSSKRDQIEKNWEDIIDTIEDEDLTDYIRFQFMSEFDGPVKPKDLFETVAGHIDKNKALEYLKHLNVEAKWFAYINRKGTDYWSKEVNDILDAFKIIKVTHGIPLLLAGAVRFGDDDNKFQNIVKATLYFCFRYFTIGDNGVANLQREIGEMARGLRSEELSIDEMITKMKKLSPDKEFKENFKTFSTKTNSLAYYILEQLENYHLSGVEALPQSLSQHVEHIMPKRPSRAKDRTTEWSHVRNEELFNEFRNRIGNLLILESNINKAASNHTFEKKVKVYKDSGLYYPHEIIDNYSSCSWDFETIKSRQYKMAETALKVWDFDSI